MRKRTHIKNVAEALCIALALGFSVFAVAARSTATVTPGINLLAPPGAGLTGPSLFTPQQAESIAGPLSSGSAVTPSSAGSSVGGSVVSKAVDTVISGLTGMTPFGGKVIIVHPNICGSMTAFSVLMPDGTTVNLMADGGTVFYKYGPPTMVGQNVLGLYTNTWVTCTPTRWTSYAGGRVFMMGSGSPAGVDPTDAASTAAQAAPAQAPSRFGNDASIRGFLAPPSNPII